MSTRWAEFLLFIVVVAQFFCLTACLTSGSRMLFAFSRDRAVPGHQLWSKVSRHRVPVWSVCAVGALGFLLMLPTWWNNLAGYYVGTSVGTTGLYIAFILPVILRWRAGDAFEKGAWSLGEALQVDQSDRDPLGRLHLDRVHAPDRARAASRGMTPASTGTS